MSTSAVTNSSIDSILGVYQPLETDNNDNDSVSQTDFLTLLVAQLENQNPLDPTDASDFTAQLAQFSQLEQLININDTLGEIMVSESSSASGTSSMDYIGMQVTGNANTMNIDNGLVSGGFYDLQVPAEVAIVIQDDQGNTVKTLEEGQKNAGTNLISWDGTDSAGNSLSDGTYTYMVMANSGNGYEDVPSSITGTVEGVVYQNGNDYLSVGGFLLDPNALTSVSDNYGGETDSSDNSVMEFLGTTVTSNYPIILVEEGQVAGEELNFLLDAPQDVTITICDAADQVVTTIDIAADQTVAGENGVSWNALGDNGYQVTDNMYYYTVQTQDGYASTSVTEEVTGILSSNGSQYLELGESGRLVALSAISRIE